MPPPTPVQILSISHSFLEILEKSYVGAPPPPGVGTPSWRVGVPNLVKSWIRHCNKMTKLTDYQILADTLKIKLKENENLSVILLMFECDPCMHVTAASRLSKSSARCQHWGSSSEQVLQVSSLGHQMSLVWGVGGTEPGGPIFRGRAAGTYDGGAVADPGFS